MTQQKPRFLTRPSRYHYTQQAKKLMQERQIQTRLRLRRRHLRRMLPIRQPRRSRRIQEQSPMRIESHRFRRVDGNFRRRILMRHIYDARTILILHAGVPSQEPLALLFLCGLVLPPFHSACAAGYDGEHEEERSEGFGGFRGTVQACAEERGVLEVEGCDGVGGVPQC